MEVGLKKNPGLDLQFKTLLVKYDLHMKSSNKSLVWSETELLNRNLVSIRDHSIASITHPIRSIFLQSG